MITWNNLDTLASYQELLGLERVNVAAAMTGEAGAERVKKYSVPMAEGMAFNYGAKQVDDDVLAVLAKFAKDAEQLEFKGAVVEGTFYDVDGVKVLATIPSREELLSKLLGSLQSPITNFARVLKQIAEQGENAAE